MNIISIPINVDQAINIMRLLGSILNKEGNIRFYFKGGNLIEGNLERAKLVYETTPEILSNLNLSTGFNSVDLLNYCNDNGGLFYKIIEV